MCEINNFIEENVDFKSDDPFYVFNVEDVIRKHHKWLELMPRVIPYYAVKSNRLPLLLDIMIGLGLRFDCASQFEMELILRRGGKAQDMIYAQTSKTNTSLKFAKDKNIDLIVFDNEEELVKISAVFPSAQLVLRIKGNEKDSDVKPGVKSGADLKIVENLLKRANDMKLNVMGIAFHVGTGRGCHSIEAYLEAIQTSRKAFDMAVGMGFSITLLDIGGGYPGTTKNHYEHITRNMTKFEDMFAAINKCLSDFYPEQNVTIIGEPGRFYCESAFTLFTKVITKVIQLNDEKIQTVMYHLNDGMHGSFTFANIHGKICEPVPFLNKNEKCRNVYSSILWGPTCDSSDCIRRDVILTEMNIGEWIVFEDMGAYSLPYTQFGFNGMPSPTVKVFVSQFAKTALKRIETLHKIESQLKANTTLPWK